MQTDMGGLEAVASATTEEMPIAAMAVSQQPMQH